MRLNLLALLLGLPGLVWLLADRREAALPSPEPAEIESVAAPVLPVPALLPSTAPDPDPPERPAGIEAAAERPDSPPPEFPLTLPREFGPGPEIRGIVFSETGEAVRGLRVRTTTWRPGGRGCFKPTYRLGWSELRPGESFVFHIDAEMLRTMPERKGRVPFRISADGHQELEVTLDHGQWADLERGSDLAVLEFRLALLRHR